MSRREHGVALILVLWLIALLTALVGAFALTARVEAGQDSVLRANARAQSVARAGMEYALWRMRGTPATRWQADGRPYDWSFDGVPVQVRIVDEGGKVDLNNASPALLAGLLRALEVEPGRAQALSAAIVDWRDRDSLQSPGGAEDPDYASAGVAYGAKDAPFESLGELRLVLGMDAELYRRLLPNVTLYAQHAQPLPAFAPPPVLTALGLNVSTWMAARKPPVGPGGGLGVNPAAASETTGTYSIESRARLGEGREGVLRALVRAGAAASRDSAYTVLQWEEGAALQ
ncbi:MAG TPA: type II secretion system minor pseudopilin GspK [Stenotrophomonas sp.]|nr:type II secretion system minor pseudopilin GspK [Stenotrophomonas sp.]